MYLNINIYDDIELTLGYNVLDSLDCLYGEAPLRKTLNERLDQLQTNRVRSFVLPALTLCAYVWQKTFRRVCAQW